MRILGEAFLVAAVTMLACSVAGAEGPGEQGSGDNRQKAPPKAAARAEAKRPPQKPIVDVAAETATHVEIQPLAVEFKQLSALRLDHCGNLLGTDEETREIKVIDNCGRLAGSIGLEFGPQAIDVAPDGTVYCGGQGRLAMLSSMGRVLRTVPIPDDASSKVAKRRRATSRPLRISGIAVSDRHVFVAFGSGWSLGSKSKLFRFDRNLDNPTLLAEGLRGCCQRCDVAIADGVVYLAENSAHRVVLYSREGEVLDKWGQRSRSDIEGFGACCNPMNLCFDGRGVLYTAESGLGRVKRYTTDGKYLGLVGYVGVERFTSAGRTAASCSNIAIAVTPGGRRVYVMDTTNNLIRVLHKKAEYVVPRARLGRCLRLFGGRRLHRMWYRRHNRCRR